MFAPPICRRRWRNNAFPFWQLRRRRRQPSEHRRERSEQSNTARCASSSEKGGAGNLFERDSLSGNTTRRGCRGAARTAHSRPVSLAGGPRLRRDRRLGLAAERVHSQLPGVIAGSPWFLDTMQQVMKQPRAGVPFKRAGHYYFLSRNNGTQNPGRDLRLSMPSPRVRL
jgi:hypothetical protein